MMTPIDSIRYNKSFLRAGFMCMEPSTGMVKAYVGGLDYSHFMYDMVMGGRRQVGSTIKPFLYSLAMETASRLATWFLTCNTHIWWQEDHGRRVTLQEDDTGRW